MLAVFKPDALHDWDQTLESHLLDECVNHYTVDQLLPIDSNYGPVGATGVPHSIRGENGGMEISKMLVSHQYVRLSQQVF